MSVPRHVRILLAGAIIVAALILVGVTLYAGSSLVSRRARVDAAVLELRTWVRGTPSLEGVRVVGGPDTPVVVLEGEVESDADLDALWRELDRPERRWMDVQVRVTVRTPPPEPDASGANNRPMDPRLDAAALTPLPVGSIDRCHAIDGIIFASQPGVEDFETFRDLGVTTVLDNRHAAETPFDERAIVEGLGMAYVNVPFSGAAEFTDDVIDRSLEVLRTADRPVLAHCQACNRTGAILLAHRVINDGLAWDDALDEARRSGLHSDAYVEVVRAYVDRQR